MIHLYFLVRADYQLEKVIVAPKGADGFVSQAKTFTWMRCTWSQPWCPQTRRAWPVHQAEGDGLQSGSPGW